MLPARERLAAHQREALSRDRVALEHAKAGARGLAHGPVDPDADPHRLRAHGERQVDFELIRSGDALCNREVGLLHATVSEGALQPSGALRPNAADHQAARLPVEPMRRIDLLAGPGLFAHQRRERPFEVAGGGMHRKPCGLVDDQEVLIAVDHRQLPRRLRFLLARTREREHHSGDDRGRGFHRPVRELAAPDDGLGFGSESRRILAHR